LRNNYGLFCNDFLKQLKKLKFKLHI